MREDLRLAAYAVALGFTLRTSRGPLTPEAFTDLGIPSDGLEFERAGVFVWETARGWRVARLGEGGTFPRPETTDFYGKLVKALQKAVEIG